MLYWECGNQYKRILDVWSHLQTGRPAVCVEGDYDKLLPQDKALQGALAKGINVKVLLKEGTCP